MVVVLPIAELQISAHFNFTRQTDIHSTFTQPLYIAFHSFICTARSVHSISRLRETNVLATISNAGGDALDEALNTLNRLACIDTAQNYTERCS